MAAKQQEIPGTEPKVPPGILRQARKVIELRDEMELAKQRHEAALDFLLSAMRRENLGYFILNDADMKGAVIFKLAMPDPKVQLEHYKKPQIDGAAVAEAAG